MAASCVYLTRMVVIAVMARYPFAGSVKTRLGSRLNESASAELYERIEWSTERTRAQTLAAAQSLGLSVELSPAWYDVDRPEDLARLEREIAPEGGVEAPRTWAVLQQLRVNEPCSQREPCVLPG